MSFATQPPTRPSLLEKRQAKGLRNAWIVSVFFSLIFFLLSLIGFIDFYNENIFQPINDDDWWRSLSESPPSVGDSKIDLFECKWCIVESPLKAI